MANYLGVYKANHVALEYVIQTILPWIMWNKPYYIGVYKTDHVTLEYIGQTILPWIM